jgi:hemerythrin-like metal-binding protein
MPSDRRVPDEPASTPSLPAGEGHEPLPWLPVLETGHPDLDREHRELIDDANDLLALVRRRAPWQELLAAARRMRDHCGPHFENEDRILRAARFPDRDRHRRAHRRVTAEMNGILAELESVDAPTRLEWELALSLRGLLLDHLLRNDLKYKSHLMAFTAPQD